MTDASGVQQDKVADEPAKPSVWERQPLGLGLYAVLVVVFAAPGLITLMIVLNTRPSTEVAWQIAIEGIFAFSTVFSLIIMNGFVGRRPFAQTGLQGRGVFMETSTGILIGAALMTVVIGILSMTRHLATVGHNVHYNWAPAALLCLLIAIAEEAAYRGYILSAFERCWGTGAALITSSLIFGAMHIINVWHEPLDIQVRVMSFIALEAGLLLGASFLATRRLWLPIGIHWAWNFFLGPFYGAPVSGVDMMGSYTRAYLSGPSWITGGKFGPEAGVVVLIVCTLAALAMIVVVARARQWRPAPGSLPW